MNLRLLLFCLLVATPAQATTRYFLGIGSSFGVDEPALRWARADAAKVQAVFVELGAVHRDRAVLLLDPSVAEVERALVRLQGNVEEAVRQGERSEVIVHYAGHGDAEHLRMNGDRYALADFKKQLAEVPAQAMVVVIDACRTSVRSRGATLGPRFEGAIVHELSPNGSAFLFSTSTGEVAQESDDIEGGFFTHALLAGLRGAADLDADGRVTLAEAWARTHATTLAHTHAAAAAQHPEIDLRLSGEGELVLTELDRARAVVSLDESIVGSVLLLEARSGRVIVEVEKLDAAPVSVAVPTGRIGIQVKSSGRTSVHRGELALEWGGRRSVGMRDLSELPRLSAVVRRGADVDSTPLHVAAAAGGFVSDYGEPGWVAALAAEHRLWTWPVFVGLTLDFGGGSVEAETWRFEHQILAGTLTAVGEVWLGPARLFGGLEAGAQLVHQSGRRKDAARIEQVLGSSPTADGWLVAPLVYARAGAAVPLRSGMSAMLLARAGAAFGRFASEESSAATAAPRAELLLGIGWEM